MKNKPKSLYWILSIVSGVSFLILIALIICMYCFKDDATLLAVFSAWISIVSGLLFSSIISLIVQIINDNVSERDFLQRKESKRTKEINLLSREISLFLSFYYDNESYLLQKYNLKESLVDGNLNSDIIRYNMKILNKAYNKANKQDKVFIENYLLLSDYIKEQYNKVVDILNKKREEFDNINIEMNSQVFSYEEIESLKIIPLYVKSYNENLYTCIEDFIKLVNIFNLKMDFNDNKWLSLIALILTNS